MDAESAEQLITEALDGTSGVQEVYTTSPDPKVGFARFVSPAEVTKFLRAQKRNPGLMKAR